MKNYKSRGIVLHTVKYGEKSLVAYLLTDVFGRQSYMAYSRSALLQPMFLVEFEGGVSSKAELHRFKEMTAAVPLRSIPFDVRKSTVALFMAELVYRLVREHEPNPELFGFIWEAVERLDGMEDGVANFHLWFLVGLSRHLGFAPAGEWREGSWFDIREGRFVRVRPMDGVCFSRENAALLWSLMEGREVGLNRTQRVEFLNAMIAFFGYHLDAVKDIRSLEVLREVF